MKKRKNIPVIVALILLTCAVLSSCSVLNRLFGGEDGTGSGITGTEEIDVFSIELRDLKGKWYDINSDHTLEFKGDRMTVRFGSWKETYKVKLQKTDYSVSVVSAEDSDFGLMGEITVNKDGSLTAYEMILDGPSRQFRFVREEAIRAETEIQDLSTDAPKTIESREIKQFILTFQNYGERYGLDADWPAGYYSWYIDEVGEGKYWMKFSISGDSYMILQYDEIVDREYVEGLADLIAEKGVVEYNGYYMKNNTDKTGYYLYVKYTSKEKLTIRAEGDAADTCPFDIPALLDYAYKATGEKNGNLYY